MKIKFEWEYLDDETTRAKVIGGWIIRSYDGNCESMVFVKDPLHVWEFE